jgi:hypothetical protein
MRAVSQNLGHEHIGTTLATYGKLDEFRVGEVISDLNFDETTSAAMSAEDVKTVEKALKILKNKT